MKLGWAIFGGIIICMAAAAIGSIANISAIPAWYETLKRPTWNPPSWLFGPVWTALYIMMGIAVGLVWVQRMNPTAQLGVKLFAIQLILNIAWSWLFFGLRSPLLGLIDIALLWSAIVATMLIFFRVSSFAGWLLVPYLAWVSFASVLNATIWWMNR